MVEINEIVDKESLEAWLEALPRTTEAEEQEAHRWAVIIAHRAAMRVLPFAWEWGLSSAARKRDLTALRFLRPNLICGVAGNSPTPQIMADAADAAADAANAAANAAYNAAANAAYAANAAAYSAANAAYAANAAADAAYAARAAADAAHAAVWEAIRADCAALVAGQSLDRIKLWHDEPNPIVDLWSTLCPQILGQGDGWRFWVDWYDNALNGEAQDWPLLTKIALIESKHWDEINPNHVNGIIADLVKEREQETQPDPVETLAENVTATKLMRGAIGDFRFDAMQSLMRIKPFAEDLKYMRDPEDLARALEDFDEIRDQLSTFGEAMNASAGTQADGRIGVYVKNVITEFDRAAEKGVLRVGTVIAYGSVLEGFCHDEAIRAELGPMVAAFEEHLSGLLDLSQRHFSSTLLRVAPLKEITLDDADDAHFLLSEARDGMRELREQAEAGALTGLAEEDWAVLDAMADRIDRQIRAQFLAGDARAKSSFQRDINFGLAQLQVSLAMNSLRSRQHAGTLATISNGLRNHGGTAVTLGRLWQMLKPFI